jgi:DNA polymerase elongation subunit (family B)
MDGSVGNARADVGPSTKDEILFGWDETPRIVSVWANRAGEASIWRRSRRPSGEAGATTVERAPFRAWVLASSPRVWEAARAERGRVTCERWGDAEGAYRFLIAAPTFHEIEDALVAGARRLGLRVARLGELGREIHQLGSVEQYLIATGRTYFRGLVYADLSRMQIDLETTSLDPARGHVFLAAVRHGAFEATLEARDEADEARLVSDLLALVRARDPDVIENHNLFGFDLPFLAARAWRWGIPLALGRDGAIAREVRAPGRAGARGQSRYRAPGRELLDTMDAVRRYDFVARELPSHGLKDVARHFGVASAQRVYVRGSETYATYLRDPARLRAYAMDDVREVDALSTRLFPATFELARMAPRRYSELAAAGPAMGVLEPILVRGYVRARAALPGRPTSTEEQPPHMGGAVHLFAAGVAERVVKADVASLYPSLMRAFRVGPESDRLGVLLTTVDRLLALRLAHKAASKALPHGSPEASHHDALQAAMKLVINSAYGYMGAGSMALFADRDAADEVTRRGRELLAGVLDDLRARGATLLQADTDGVYFAVREGTTEAEERAIVAAVAARLPAGIRLEYEGRYRAMLSYEVKNYALLTYGGELVVRGVALRSSRAEPFGTRFLREALASALRNDAAGVLAAFTRATAALRARDLPTRDVTTRVRITKTPTEYLRTRASHREAPYEALLGAGRTQWTPGERVRHYRSRTRGYVLHTDEADEASADPRDYDVEHYERVLVRSYASRLACAYRAEDWERLFRTEGQGGLFDTPLDAIKTIRMNRDAAA